MSQALMFSSVVFLAITISCCFSGVAGAMVPLVMKKLGADPAMASAAVVTTFTDVGCLLVFLGLAAVLWSGQRKSARAEKDGGAASAALSIARYEALAACCASALIL